MPGQTLTTEAFVIEKRPPADAFQTFGLFSAEHGNLLALQRVPRKPSPAHVAPDLFDTVSAMLESSNQGRTWFVREVRIVARRAAIGRSYDALRFASALVAVIGRNPVHEESRPNVEQLLRTALDAFGEAGRPDIVHLKSLYLFARDEGYPVRQDWLPALPAADRAIATAVLNRRLGEQDSAAAEVARIRRSLEHYLNSRTEIAIP
ncbi:MAG TPA: hypothetical protein VN775_09575 [Opitutaceae bacterium]|nr:hypothetical protein [Opitutaceae bacterium]